MPRRNRNAIKGGNVIPIVPKRVKTYPVKKRLLRLLENSLATPGKNSKALPKPVSEPGTSR